MPHRAHMAHTDPNPTHTQPAPKPVKRNATVTEFCERAPMSRSTFWDLVRIGKIPVIRFGRITVVPHDEAERLLSEGIR
jgi:hypothetical protein